MTGRARGRHLLAILATLAVGLLVGDPGPAASQPTEGGAAPATPQSPERRVLLLYGEPRLTPAIVVVDERIRDALESRSPVPTIFYTEYLDLNLFDGDAPQPELRELLRRKYATRPLDIIIAAGSRALRIALGNRDALFARAPVVFLGVDQTAAADLRLDADVTGIWLRQAWAETLDLARRLQPGTRRAVVVTGSSPADRVWLAEARRQLAAPPPPIETRYLATRAFQDVLTEVAALPPETVILVGPFLRDETGQDFLTPQAVTRIAEAATVPVYTLLESVLGTGAVGGQVVSFEAHGAKAAELALRVLAGERPPPTGTGTTVAKFDARQLARWGLDARRLPASSVVLFREPSLWEQHRWTVVGAAGVLLLESGLIAGLLVQRTKRRRAQTSLAKRLRFETLLSDLSSGFAASTGADTEHAIQEGLRLVGHGLQVDWATVRVLDEKGGGARLVRAWTRPGVSPRPEVLREDQTPWTFARLRQGHSLHLANPGELPHEAAIDRESLGRLQIASMVVLPLVSARGVFGFFSVGLVRDGPTWVAEHLSRLRLVADTFANALERRRADVAAREAEARIRDLAGRLMTAQEEERRRIARDLHDDANQELAALAIALSTLGSLVRAGRTAGLQDELGRLQARTVTLSESIRHLSHELHPGVLDHVGLVGALRGYCRDFQREHGLTVTFRADGECDAVPADVALCLYRVTQEGLGNVARHAKASEAHVFLDRKGHDVHLTIGDDGRGFDVAEARRQHGLGLISLEERVRLSGGRLTIDSPPQGGTELRIVVPLREVRDGPCDGAAG